MMITSTLKAVGIDDQQLLNAFISIHIQKNPENEKVMKQITRYSHRWRFVDLTDDDIKKLDLEGEEPLTVEECLKILKLKNDVKIEQ